MRTPLWLRRLRGWLASHDPHWKPTGVIVKFADYDEEKAVAGYAKSRRQTETGRPYQLLPTRNGVVIDMKRRQQ